MKAMPFIKPEIFVVKSPDFYNARGESGDAVISFVNLDI